MTDDPKTALWDLFWRLPGGQQLALVGLALAVGVLGAGVGRWATNYKVEKVEVEKAGLQNEINRLNSLVPTDSIAQLDDSSTPTCADYDVRIMGEKKRTEDANKEFAVEVTAGRLPKNSAVWLVSTKQRGHKEGYWGPRPAELDGSVWKATVPAHKTGKRGDTIHYTIFVVGIDGESLLRAYRNTMLYFSPDGKPKEWPILIETTSDMVDCKPRIEVKFE